MDRGRDMIKLYIFLPVGPYIMYLSKASLNAMTYQAIRAGLQFMRERTFEATFLLPAFKCESLRFPAFLLERC